MERQYLYSTANVLQEMVQCKTGDENLPITRRWAEANWFDMPSAASRPVIIIKHIRGSWPKADDATDTFNDVRKPPHPNGGRLHQHENSSAKPE